MTCVSVRQNLGGFLYDELDGRLRRELEVHVGRCAACRSELHSESRLVRALTERMRDISEEIER